MKIIQDKISDIVLSMSSEDYSELPDSVSSVLGNKLSGKLLKEYQKFERDALLAVEGQDGELNAVNAAVLTNKLLQFCSGEVYGDEDGEGNRPIYHFHDLKLDTLDEIIEANPDDNLLVAYNYKHELDRLVRKYPDAVVLDKEGKAIEKWNKGDIKMLLVHPKCLSGDTEVLTEYSGWKKIIDIKMNERVFDGIEFVNHKGCHYSGTKEVIDVFGIEMTPDHKLLINNKWTEARNVRVSKQEGCYRYNGSNTYLSAMLSMPNRIQDEISGFQTSQQTWGQTLQTLFKRQFSLFNGNTDMEQLERFEVSSKRQIGQKLWWSRYFNGQPLVGFQRILQRYGRKLSGWIDYRKNKCKWRLHKRKLYMDKSERATKEQKDNASFDLQREENTFSRVGKDNGTFSMRNNYSIEQGNERGRSDRRYKTLNLRDRKTRNRKTEIKKKRVYDLVDCGPRNRFLIRNKDGEVFVSHNSAGHGLNLQHGGSLLVWFSFTWSLEEYQQLNKRLHRQGQKNLVRIMHIAVGDVEERLMRSLTRKDITQKGLLDSLK